MRNVRRAAVVALLCGLASFALATPLSAVSSAQTRVHKRAVRHHARHHARRKVTHRRRSAAASAATTAALAQRRLAEAAKSTTTTSTTTTTTPKPAAVAKPKATRSRPLRRRGAGRSAQLRLANDTTSGSPSVVPYLVLLGGVLAGLIALSLGAVGLIGRKGPRARKDLAVRTKD